MKNMNINMLHMKLNSAVSVFAVAAAFSVLLPPSVAFAGVCFLPDCSDEDLAGGGGNMDMNEDTAFCESKGFTYYASGKCPQYYAVVGTCNRDDHYLKCDAKTWCQQNGYNTTKCSIPQYVNDPCPSYGSLYKGCKTDNDRACKETGFTKTCPSGQKLKKNSGRCTYDNSYGTCCKPSGCPNYTSLTSSSYGTNGTDGCEYTCYYTCNMNCPSGTSTSNPGGCGGSTRNGCGTKTCYYPYQSCCTPSCSDTTSSCSCGSYTISDGCGGTCRRCESCCNSSSSNWCSVHSTCHGDCCSDGTIQSCDSRCGGSGCSSGGGSSGGGSGGSSGPRTGRIWFEPTNNLWCYNSKSSQCPSNKPIPIIQSVHEWCDCGGGIHEYDRGMASGYKSGPCYATVAECSAAVPTDGVPKSNGYLSGSSCTCP